MSRRDQARPFSEAERAQRYEFLASVAIEAAVFIFLLIGAVGCIYLLAQP